MPIAVEIIDSPIDTNSLAGKVSADENGAVVIFLGITRNHHEGRGVKYLEYECYRDMALAEFLRVAELAAKTHGIKHLYAVHRIGRVNIGEASLGVAASSAHRAQAFAAAQMLVDELKKDVPIWKREYFSDGSIGWVEGGCITPSTKRL
ncbi:MAG: molybdenum cofactor biosynthesis protein MoaE [Planctomycetaceae bacterium]|nr:molybdenum cofactor biosynthesis protein MoaE [Planctomycetaceae bacterium]